MKKVLFLTKSEMIGGIEKVLIDIVGFLDPSKYEVTVMTGQHNSKLEQSLPKHVNYKSLFRKRFKGLDRLLVHLPPKILHKLFIRKLYDIEISFQEGYPTKIISGASKATKKICWFHNDPLYYDFNLPFFRSKTKLCSNLEDFDEIIAVSKFIAHRYENYLNLNNPIKVVYNPLDSSKIRKLSKQKIVDLNKRQEIFRLCYVGRLSEEKQIDMLISSIIALHSKYPYLELVIIGEGHKYDDIHDKVISAHAEGYIKLLGYKNNPYPYIDQSSMLVCCSKTESFCLVVAESITIGTPVLSTRCGGPEEILEDGNYGLLVENNVEALTLGIEEMVQNKNLYMSYRNKSKGFRKYEKDCVKKQIECVLEGDIV